MRASVLIGAHNEGSRLWRTVESILESGIGKSAEIVVADDASSDDSVSELKKRFPQIVVVEQPERSGVSSTRGLAVRQARGDTLVFLDGHTKPGRGSIERLVSSVERTSGKAIITPRIEGLDGETWKSLPQQLGSGYALDLETFDSWWISEKKMKEVKVGGQTYFESPALVGCSLAVSRDLYDHLWGFDVHMRQYGVEDLDFALKAWLMGSRVLHDPEATVAHRFQHLFSGYEVGAEYPLANQIRSARKNFTQSAWEEWVERAQENNRKRLADHPEGLWARAWEIFQKDRASAEQERSHLMAKRVRDEFWFARRFERSWPAMGAAGATSLSLVRPPLRRAQTTLLAEAKPSKEPTKPTLQIVNVLKQDDQDIAGTTLTRMAGQQISIQAKASDGSSLSNIRWTLSHDKYAIKSYTENDITSPINSTASFSMLSSSDLQQTNISFYWIRRDVNGGTFEAEVTATLSGSSEPKMVKVRFDIVEPTYTGSSQTTGVDVGPFSLLPNFDVSSPNALYCGKMSGTVGTPGIYWNFNVNAGASVSGGLRLTQMIKSLGTIVSGGTSINCPNTAGAYQLDNWASYPSSSPAISIVSNSSAAVPSTADSVADAPYTSLDDSWTSYSRSDRFRMYLMFYPDQADDGGACIWISLAVIEWGWAGSAQHAPAGWAGGGSQTHNNPKPKNSWTLPAWSKVFNNQTACQ